MSFLKTILKTTQALFQVACLASLCSGVGASGAQAAAAQAASAQATGTTVARSTIFKLNPEMGPAKYVVLGLADMHEVIFKSQLMIAQALLASTTTKIIFLYGSDFHIDDVKRQVERALKNKTQPNDLQRLEYLPVQRNSHSWARDYVPELVTDGKSDRLVSFRYANNEQLGKDAAVILAKRFKLPVPNRPDLFLEPGSFLIDSSNRLFITDIVASRNKKQGLDTFAKLNDGRAFSLDRERSLIPKTVKQTEAILKEALGATQVIWIPALPIDFEGTGHLDMYAKVLNARNAVVAQSKHPEVNKYLDVVAQKFSDAGFRITRIKNGNEDSYGFKSYTNSLIVDNLVLLPKYGAREDKQAIEAYQKLGFSVLSIDGSSINFGGSVHCLTKILNLP